MPNSSFWHDLAEQFDAIEPPPRLRADRDYIVGTGVRADWRISGPSGAIERLRFERLARQGGAAISGVQTEDTLQRWLDTLEDRDLNFQSRFGGVEVDIDGKEGASHLLGCIVDLRGASRTLCLLLEMKELKAGQESLKITNNGSPSVAIASTAKTKPERGDSQIQARAKSTFPNRASWLRDRLRERGWNKYNVQRQGGPDHKTVQKILAGEHVREDVLEKLASALSKARPSMKLIPVNLLNVPQD